jgi:hypothetical protein
MGTDRVAGEFTEGHGLAMAGRCGSWMQRGACLRLATLAELAQLHAQDREVLVLSIQTPVAALVAALGGLRRS